jgi:transposase
MIRIVLSEPEIRQLEDVLRMTSNPKLRHRTQIILMAHREFRHQDIAAATGVNPRSVQRWLNTYLEAGLEGLMPRTAKGATPTLTPDLAPLLRQWVIDGPAAHGLDRANWTYAELADHLLKTRGIRIRKSALQAFGAKHGIRPYRPTYRYLRGDPDKQAKGREEVEELKKKRRPGRSSS